MLTVGVLGPLEVLRDGRPVSIPAGKPAEVLARLAVSVETPVSVGALLEDVWGEPTARNTVQSKISQLRRALGTDTVVMSGDGYLLRLPPDAVDASQVAALAARSAAARAAGDPATSLSSAARGLRLFRGEVLSGAGRWAVDHQLRLDEIRLGLVEDAAAARVDLGGGADLVPELEELTRSHPLRESLWVSLITALYRAGRQADALAAYRRIRILLADELGLEPGPALRSVERAVLRQSRSLDSGRAEPPPVIRAAGNLPAPAGSTIGRDDDVARLLTALDHHRLVTVLGTGGVGKTRVSLDAGRRRTPPGGVWLISLDTADADTPLWRLIAETLRVTAKPDALRSRLAGAATVLLLDNCEHLLPAVALVVAELMSQVPTLRVLTTSQAPLGLPAEFRYELEPLSLDASTELFVRLAEKGRRRFRVTPENAPVIEDVCRSLDGLPLAIELAAARVRSLSVKEIARRLDDRFTLLSDPSSALPRRRSTLVGAIDWSYGLLFSDDRRGLWALSCFVGGASLAGVTHVLATLDVPETAVLDVIGRLVDRSLVIVDDVDTDAEADVVSYRLLDSVRAFAADRLDDSGLAPRAAAAWADWFAGVAARCEREVRGAQQPSCLLVARAERANLDAVLEWCRRHDPVLGSTIAADLGWTWVVLGDGTAGASRLRRALDDRAPTHGRIRGWLVAGWLEASTGDLGLARDDLDRARRLIDGLPSDPDTDLLRADLDRHEAFLAIQQGAADRVRATAARSLIPARLRPDAWRVAAGLLLGAFGAVMSGDLSSAARDAEEAVTIVSRLQDAWGLVHGHAILAAVAQAELRFSEAAQMLSEAADTAARSGFAGQAALHRATLARVQHRAGDRAALPSYGGRSSRRPPSATADWPPRPGSTWPAGCAPTVTTTPRSPCSPRTRAGTPPPAVATPPP